MGLPAFVQWALTARFENCLHFVRLTCHLKLSVSIHAIQEWWPFWQKSNRSMQLDVGCTHTYICTYDRHKITVLLMSVGYVYPCKLGAWAIFTFLF